jgi:DNA-binding GntR family transcriptional regulator
MLNRDSIVPPWQQITDTLRERIASGAYAPGHRVPSIIALAAEFDVAPVTARKALTALQREGLIESRTGWGTFVTPKDKRPA